MKKYIIIVALTVFLAGSVMGIDRAKKDPTPPDTTQQVTQDDNTQKTTHTKTNREFDNFIDKNNNGIDDRAEKNKPSQTKKKTAEPKETSPAKP